jgi:hypothetical protein
VAFSSLIISEMLIMQTFISSFATLREIKEERLGIRDAVIEERGMLNKLKS